MIKVIKINGFDLEDIEMALNKNSSWKLLSFGSNYHWSKGIGLCVPPKKHDDNFMVVESIGDDVKEFEI
jgi:hypothetical protein